MTSSYIAVASSSNQTPSTGGTVNSSYWNYAAKGQASSPTTTQGDLIVRGASADGRLAIGSAGQVLKVNSSANGLEYGTGTTILQVKNLYYSNTPNSFSNQSPTSLGANNVYYPTGGRFGGSFTKLSSTSKILVFGKMSYIMSNTNVVGLLVMNLISLTYWMMQGTMTHMVVVMLIFVLPCQVYSLTQLTTQVVSLFMLHLLLTATEIIQVY